MPSHPSDPRSASSRDRLLEAAKRLFAAQGYEQTATSAIARRAGTSESQLMRYFGGKGGLLEALFDEAWADLNTRVQRAVESTTGGRETILNVLQTIAGALARDSDLALLLLFEGRRLRGGQPRVKLSRGLLAFTDIARGLVKKAQQSGELDPTLDTSALTSAILGASEAMIRDRTVARTAGTRVFAEREMRRTLEAILAGFAPSGQARAQRSATRASRRVK